MYRFHKTWCEIFTEANSWSPAMCSQCALWVHNLRKLWEFNPKTYFWNFSMFSFHKELKSLAKVYPQLFNYVYFRLLICMGSFGGQVSQWNISNAGKTHFGGCNFFHKSHFAILRYFYLPRLHPRLHKQTHQNTNSEFYSNRSMIVLWNSPPIQTKVCSWTKGRP